jgi:hypothetical protein
MVKNWDDISATIEQIHGKKLTVSLLQDSVELAIKRGVAPEQVYECIAKSLKDSQQNCQWNSNNLRDGHTYEYIKITDKNTKQRNELSEGDCRVSVNVDGSFNVYVRNDTGDDLLVAKSLKVNEETMKQYTETYAETRRACSSVVELIKGLDKEIDAGNKKSDGVDLAD